jgi:polysaccharide export outer membrane protein
MNKNFTNNNALSFILITLLLITSCGTTKNVPYFQDVSLIDTSEISPLAVFKEPIIQADDIMSISLYTIDPISSMIVNQVGSQALSGNSGQSGSLGATPATSGFLVDKNGEIYLSVIGKIKVGGLTTFQARELLTNKASVVYEKPNVQIRFANFKVTVLGEVAHPSVYVLPNEQVSVLDALGLAGDLTIYGKRENILLIRNINGKKVFARLNLNSKALFSSPYFYLKQNDVLYIEPNKGKAATLNQARTQTIAITGTALTVLVTIFSRLL